MGTVEHVVQFNTNTEVSPFPNTENPFQAHVFGWCATIPIVVIVCGPCTELPVRRVDPRFGIQNKGRVGIVMRVDILRIQGLTLRPRRVRGRSTEILGGIAAAQNAERPMQSGSSGAPTAEGILLDFFSGSICSLSALRPLLLALLHYRMLLRPRLNTIPMAARKLLLVTEAPLRILCSEKM